jgi:hypothetical protein
MRAFVAAVLLVAVSPLHAQEKTFEGCSLTAWEIFHAINDFVLGVPLTKAKSAAGVKDNVETAYDIAKKKGLEEAYLAGHVHYKKCSGDLAKLRGALSPAEAAYKECAYKSATRTNVLIRIKEGTPISETKSKMPEQFHELITTLYRTVQENNLTKELAMSAESSMSCIAAVQQKYR